MSATPALSELEPLLASLNELKAPGANKSKIASITSICVKNIQAEQSIVQSFYRALKKAPSTHKLGALYVIDSVIRQWTDKAKKAGQELHLEGSGRGEPGTYSAALKRVAELMPALLDDTLTVIPNDQKPKLQNLVDIWDRGNFFPSKIIAESKQKIAQAVPQSAQANGAVSAAKFKPAIPTRPIQTPIGLPPQHLYDRGLLVAKGLEAPQNGVKSPATQQPAQPPADVNNILAALAASAPKPQSLPPPPVAAAPQAMSAPPAIPANFMAMLAQQGAPVQSLPPQFGMPPVTAPPFNPAAFQPPAGFPGFPLPVAAPPQFPQTPAPAPAQDPLGPLRGLLPANILNDRQKLMQALNLLQELQSGGVPMDQWVPVIQAFSEQAEQQAGLPPQGNGRARSRSPDRRGGRGSPVYGNYDDSQRQAQDERARYRQRTPTRNSPSASGVAYNGNPMQPKIIIIDNSLPKDNIKVLSRTLFVGGANGTQQEIHTLFERFGRVQTCIANRDKRHAFVKMTTRQFALNAKAGMEQMQVQNDREVMNIARQTKWGVGFGPRECCDYARGESTIPIHKLTDADVKWLLSAEYGGTGGQELHGGMVLEEPDIEIGAGVSSKAMSKRVAPDGTQINRQGKDRGGRRHNDRDRAPRGGSGGRGDDVQMGGMPMEAYGYARPEPVAVATPPAVPGFGFTLPGR